MSPLGIIAVAAVLVCVIAGGVTDNYFSMKHDEEMAKAGLVQRKEGLTVLWVKP